MSTQLQFKVIGGEDLSAYSENQFSLITIALVLHHVKPLEKYLRDMFRVLEPGGFVYVREHDCTTKELSAVLDIQHAFGPLVYAKTQREGYLEQYWRNYFTKEYLTEQFCGAGFVHEVDAPYQRRLYRNADRQGLKRNSRTVLRNPLRSYSKQKPNPNSSPSPSPSPNPDLDSDSDPDSNPNPSPNPNHNPEPNPDPDLTLAQT